MEAKLDDILAKLNQQSSVLAQQTVKLEALDDIERKISDLSGTIQAMSNKITQIETTQITQGSNLNTIKADLEDARTEINMLKQQNLNAEFVLYGLPPEVNTEQSRDIVKNFCVAVDSPINDHDITKCYARHNAAKTETIIVGSFVNASLKEELKKSFNQKKPVVVEDVVLSLPARSKWRGKEVVMRNQLTEYNRQLLREAHQLNENRYKYIWESNGRIMLRKLDGDRPLVIKTKAQLITAMAIRLDVNPEQSQTTSSASRTMEVG